MTEILTMDLVDICNLIDNSYMDVREDYKDYPKSIIKLKKEIEEKQETIMFMELRLKYMVRNKIILCGFSDFLNGNRDNLLKYEKIEERAADTKEVA